MCSIEWCHSRWPWVTPNPSFKVTVQFKCEYLANGASDPLHVWFYARVFWVCGSNGATCGSIKSKMAADGHLGYTKMAITSQPLWRSTLCLVLVWGFRGRPISWCNLQWPWVTTNSSFKVTVYFKGKYLANGACHGQIYQCFMRLRWVYYSEDNITTFSKMTRTSRGPSATAKLVVEKWPNSGFVGAGDKIRYKLSKTCHNSPTASP